MKENQASTEQKKGHTIEHRQDQYGIRPEAQEFPMMCVISFVYVCNAQCPNCPYTNSAIRSDYKDRPLMNEDTFRLIADQCGEYGAWVRISGGGEPMLHPKAVELVEYAKKAGAKIGLITNGSRFTGESSRRLLEAQVDMIEFSVDAADPETYDKVRKGLDWDTLLTNVKRMVELRNRMQSATKIIASGVNQTGVDIDAVAKFWEPLVDNFQKRKYLTWGINDPSKSADPDPYLPPEQMIPCPFLFERLNIDSRGKVMVCGFDIAAVTDMGNIHEKSIKEIWHGEGFEFYRQKHLSQRGSELELCKNCPDWKYRSWKHNYWKIVKNAEEKRQQRYEKLDLQDAEGCMAEEEKD
ncbi:MAG: radical SAM protein [Alphaproteobacteria bacterium]|uniref:Radical SAM protein n=1 Tax=Candidatus Nitrobium versatile TaxID=2884831 RepID=A0A953M224_9BACT|nr:radical SAM protein [Candidatus Nitrobium versatile]